MEIAAVTDVSAQHPVCLPRILLNNLIQLFLGDAESFPGQGFKISMFINFTIKPPVMHRALPIKTNQGLLVFLLK